MSTRDACEERAHCDRFRWAPTEVQLAEHAKAGVVVLERQQLLEHAIRQRLARLVVLGEACQKSQGERTA
jgi:hypothetical protein